MKNWSNSTEFLSASDIDSIIGRIKTKKVTDHDIDRIIGAIVKNSDIKTYNFEYIDVSFTGNYQQKLLVTIFNEDIGLMELGQSAKRFGNYFKDITPEDISMAVIANAPSVSFSLLPCITDEVEDVFNYN
jgi:hypothetical protein